MLVVGKTVTGQVVLFVVYVWSISVYVCLHKCGSACTWVPKADDHMSFWIPFHLMQRHRCSPEIVYVGVVDPSLDSRV